MDRVTAGWGSGVRMTESGVNGASGRAGTQGFSPARTGEKQSLPRSVTGLDVRKSGEFAGAERNVASVVSDIFLSAIIIPVGALRTGHDRLPAGTVCPAG